MSSCDWWVGRKSRLRSDKSTRNWSVRSLHPEAKFREIVIPQVKFWQKLSHLLTCPKNSGKGQKLQRCPHFFLVGKNKSQQMFEKLTHFVHWMNVWPYRQWIATSVRYFNSAHFIGMMVNCVRHAKAWKWGNRSSSDVSLGNSFLIRKSSNRLQFVLHFSCAILLAVVGVLQLALSPNRRF